MSIAQLLVFFVMRLTCLTHDQTLYLSNASPQPTHRNANCNRIPTASIICRSNSSSK